MWCVGASYIRPEKVFNMIKKRTIGIQVLEGSVGFDSTENYGVKKQEGVNNKKRVFSW